MQRARIGTLAASLGMAACSLTVAGCALSDASFQWRRVTIAGAAACLPVAYSQDAQERGLQNVKRVARPMVFAYSPASRPQFWMKDTPSALTGVWIGGSNRVIGYWQGRPESEATHSPPAAVSAVIEYRAGAPVPPRGAVMRIGGSCRPPDQTL